MSRQIQNLFRAPYSVPNGLQITDAGFFSSMPPEAFAMAFGTEWFIKHGAAPGVRPGWLFE